MHGDAAVAGVVDVAGDALVPAPLRYCPGMQLDRGAWQLP
jgi:hypothetical protein